MKVTLNLTLHERFLCLGILNNIKNADIVEWGFIDEAQSIFASNDEVRKEYNLKQTPIKEDGSGGEWTWNKKGDKEAPYELSLETFAVLKKEVLRIDKGKTIPKNLVVLARKILA
jgi:hypothetical protein